MSRSLFSLSIVLFINTCLSPGAQASPPAYGLNDVSILYPLPATTADRNRMLLTASSLLPNGKPLLSQADITRFPTPPGLPTEQFTDPDLYPMLSVVAVRLDPCFRDLPTDACRPQIRLILQTISSGNADDVAIHLFYDVSLADLTTLVQATRQDRLKSKSDAVFTALPLSVHPLINNSATNAFRDSFNQRLKALLGHATLERVAFFAQDLDGPFLWKFASFNLLPGGKIVPLQIAHLNVASEDFVNTGSVSDGVSEFSGDATTVDPGTDELFAFLTSSESYKKSGNLPDLISKVQRVENPTVNLPGTVDCVSCHTARAVQNNLIASKVLSEADFLKNSYASKMFSNATLSVNVPSLTDADSDARILRAFGYFGALPIVSPRVANESAKVAEFFSNQK